MICAFSLAVLAFSEMKEWFGDDAAQWVLWVSGVASLLLGTCCGLCLMRCPIIPVVAGGASVGHAVSNILELDGIYFWICTGIIAFLAAVIYLS